MSRGRIFDLQRYAVHDGPGIRTLVFLKGCPLRCGWCSNPESHEAQPEPVRRRLLCASCGRCAAACVRGAIRLGAEGPVLNRAVCSRCAAFDCAEACPHEALAKAGREAEASEVLSQVERDRDFYRNSGGGVTFSGGEPFFQPAFLRDLLEGCRRSGLHAAVETCGFAASKLFLELEALVDLFLFDLKVLEPSLHRRHTSQDNGLILENFRLLAARAPGRLLPRLTLVPGVSDTDDNLRALAGLLKACGLARVELLAYHPLGRGKWEGLGRTQPYQARDGFDDGAMIREASAVLNGLGVSAAGPFG